VTLPSRGGTTQVDHVVVSPFGVFVIDKKHERMDIRKSQQPALDTDIPQEEESRHRASVLACSHGLAPKQALQSAYR
jgi:hypothetical protein